MNNLRTQYKVYITPRLRNDTYGDEVDVSDHVQLKGLGAIKRNIDAGEYDFGAFTYSDVTMTCSNADGFFNNADDSRSMFPYSRDLAKVRIVFFQDQDQETITYRGLINDEATRTVLRKDEIQFRVLSRDSIIKKTNIEEGLVQDGDSFKTTIFRILNVDAITNILTIDLTNINPTYNGTVDLGSEFDNRSSRDAINELLIASNSVMTINEDDEVIVQSRTETSTQDPLLLFGQGDLKGRENIIDIIDYNTGLQRVFNVITLNERTTKHLSSILAFGAREKTLSYSWLTNTTTIDAVASALVEQFKYPKIELSLKVHTFIAKDYDLLERVSVDYPLKAFPTSAFLPICGAFACGDADYKTPIISGSISIKPNVGFKIIEKSEDTKNFSTTLKIRQIGTEIDDGNF